MSEARTDRFPGLTPVAAANPAPPLAITLFSEVEAVVDVNDFVEGLLIAGGMSVVYGEPNSGKTFMVLDLAFHVARGAAWFGREVEQGGVLYLALEGGSGIRNRIAAYRQANSLDDANIQFALITQPINLLEQDGVDALVAAIQELETRFEAPLKLAVVDTTSRALAGGDENSSIDMGCLIANADKIRAETGIHIVFIHHSGKDTTRGARGWSGLRGAIDTEIEVTEEDGLRRAEVKKQRDLDTGAGFAFTLETVELGRNRRAKPVSSCIIRQSGPGDAKQADPTRSLTGHTRRAYEVLRDTIIVSGISGCAGVPSGILSIPEQGWRDAFYSNAMPGAEASTRKKTFRRSADALIARRLAAMANGSVWITSKQQPEQDDGGTSRLGGH